MDVDVKKIKPHPKNPRRGNISAIKESIEKHGFLGSIVVQKSTGYIIVGNHRYKAAVALGYKALPVHYVDVDDEKAHKILVADNKASDFAIWDDVELKSLLESLPDLDGTLFAELPGEEEPEKKTVPGVDKKTQNVAVLCKIKDLGALEDAITKTGLVDDRAAAFAVIVDHYLKNA